MKKYINYKLALSVGLLSFNTLASCVNGNKSSFWPFRDGLWGDTQSKWRACSKPAKYTLSTLGTVTVLGVLTGTGIALSHAWNNDHSNQTLSMANYTNTNGVDEETFKTINSTTNLLPDTGNKLKPVTIDLTINNAIAKLDLLELDALQKLEGSLNKKMKKKDHTKATLTLVQHLTELKNIIKNHVKKLSRPLSSEAATLEQLIKKPVI